MSTIAFVSAPSVIELRQQFLTFAAARTWAKAEFGVTAKGWDDLACRLAVAIESAQLKAEMTDIDHAAAVDAMSDREIDEFYDDLGIDFQEDLAKQHPTEDKLPEVVDGLDDLFGTPEVTEAVAMMEDVDPEDTALAAFEARDCMDAAEYSACFWDSEGEFGPTDYQLFYRWDCWVWQDDEDLTAADWHVLARYGWSLPVWMTATPAAIVARSCRRAALRVAHAIAVPCRWGRAARRWLGDSRPNLMRAAATSLS